MATSKSAKDRASATGSADNAVRTGLAAAFDRIIEMGPQAAALQNALLGGIVRSQQKEAERLAAAYGKDDDRVARAQARVQLFDGLQGEAVEHAGQVGRFADALKRGGIFHGYVLQPDGSPAPGCTVRVEVSD